MFQINEKLFTIGIVLLCQILGSSKVSMEPDGPRDQVVPFQAKADSLMMSGSYGAQGLSESRKKSLSREDEDKQRHESAPEPERAFVGKLDEDKLESIISTNSVPVTASSSQIVNSRKSLGAPSSCSYLGDNKTEFHCPLESRCLSIKLQRNCSNTCQDEPLNFAHNELKFGDHEFGHWFNDLQLQQDTASKSLALAISPTLWHPYLMKKDTTDHRHNEMDGPATKEPDQLDNQVHESQFNEILGRLVTSSTNVPSSDRSNTEFVYAALVLDATGTNYKALARLKAPIMSQTANGCQLRFKYCIFAGKAGKCEQKTTPTNEYIATLRLLATSKDAQELMGVKVAGIPRERLSLVTKELWSRSIDSIASTSRGACDQWSVGVAELGHLGQVVLSFEAELRKKQLIGVGGQSFWSELSGPDSGASGKNDDRRTPLMAGASPLGLAPNGLGFVALKWIAFEGCNWPQAMATVAPPGPIESVSHQPTDGLANAKGPQLRVRGDMKQHHGSTKATRPVVGLNELAGNKIVDRSRKLQGERTMPLATKSLEPRATKSANVLDTTADIRLHDCTTTISSSSSSNVITSATNSRADVSIQTGKQTTVVPTTSDRPVYGEPVGLGAQSQAEQVWVLNPGNWPSGGIRIKNVPSEAVNLPNMAQQSLPDTYQSIRLSTDYRLMGRPADFWLPNSGNSNAEPNEESGLWMSLDSPLMEKVLETDQVDCRVKFYFNLMVPFAENSRLEMPMAPLKQDQAEDHDNDDELVLPFRIFLAIEHFIVPNNGADSVKRKLDDNVRQPAIGTPWVRKLDALVQMEQHQDGPRVNDELLSGDKNLLAIQYSTVDFWREVNFKLTDLQAGDLFFIRVTLNLELTRLDDEARRLASQVTINLDDFSAHFGCFKSTSSPEADTASANRPLNLWQLYKEQQKLELREYLAKHNYVDASNDNYQPGKQSISMQVSVQANLAPNDGFPRRNPSKHALQHPMNPITDIDYVGHHHVEPEKLVLYVLGAVACISGVISVIVFVLVPYVERVMMDYHEGQQQIQFGLSGEIADLRIGCGSSSGFGGYYYSSSLANRGYLSSAMTTGDWNATTTTTTNLSSTQLAIQYNSLMGTLTNEHLLHQHYDPLEAAEIQQRPAPSFVQQQEHHASQQQHNGTNLAWSARQNSSSGPGSEQVSTFDKDQQQQSQANSSLVNSLQVCRRQRLEAIRRSQVLASTNNDCGDCLSPEVITMPPNGSDKNNNLILSDNVVVVFNSDDGVDGCSSHQADTMKR